MKRLTKLVKKIIPEKISGLINAAILFALVLILCIGGYSVLDSYYVYALSEVSSIIYTTPAERQEAMDRNYPASVAWLYIEDTVDEPLMQGSNNTEYLNKAPDGSYSLRGSLYIDSRNAADFTDDYTLIYGHHMAFYQMFGALDHYLKEPDYWTEEHMNGIMLLKDETELPFRIFAAGSIDASVTGVFQPGEPSETDIITFLTTTTDLVRNDITDRKELEGERIVCFSTCQSPDSTLRTCVFAILEENRPHEDD